MIFGLSADTKGTVNGTQVTAKINRRLRGNRFFIGQELMESEENSKKREAPVNHRSLTVRSDITRFRKLEMIRSPEL